MSAEGLLPAYFLSVANSEGSSAVEQSVKPDVSRLILLPVTEQQAAIEIKLSDQTRLALHGP
jgi:hypothetical protein